MAATANAGAANEPPSPAALPAADYVITTVNGPIPAAQLLQAPAGMKSVPSTSPVVIALAPLFNWKITPSGEQALLNWEWNQVLMPASNLEACNLGHARASNSIEHDLDDATATTILTALATGRAFENPINDFDALDEALIAARKVLDAAGKVDELTPPPSGIIKLAQFDTPGQPPIAAQAARYQGSGRGRRLVQAAVNAVNAVPPNPGPVELRFLKLCTWASLYILDADLPGKRLALIRRYLGDVLSDAERRDESSACRLAAADLYSGIQALQPRGTSSVSAPKAAKELPNLMDQLMLFPPEFVSLAVDDTSIAQDLSDRVAYCTGRTETKDRIERNRIGNATEREYPCAGEVMMLVSGGAARLRLYDSARSALLSSADASGLPSEVLPLLEPKLADLADVTRGAIAAGKTPAQLITLFRAEAEREHVEGKQPAIAADADGYLGDVGSFERGALGRAFRSETYRALVDREAEFEFYSASGQKEALAEAFLSNSMVVIRFLCTRSKRLRGEHDFLGKLWSTLVEMRNYFSDAQSYDESKGDRRTGTEEYEWTDAALKALCSGAFDRDWVNAESGGALLLEDSISVRPHIPVPASEIYTVDAPLKLAQSFVHSTMVALSYPRESNEHGKCWWDVFQFQRDFITYTHSVGGSPGADLRTYANQQFHTALTYAGTLFINQLTAVEVRDAALLFALPTDAPYFTNLQKRMGVAEPLRVLQKAFPGLVSSTAAPSLPGTSAPPAPKPPSAHKPPPKGGPPSGGNPPKGGPKGGGGAPSGPGTKASMAVWLTGTLLMFGTSVVYDVAAIAKECKISDLTKVCWPFVLSDKGDNAMIFCPHSAQADHSSPSAAAHRRPAGIEAFAKKHSRKPTAAEIKKGVPSGKRQGGGDGRPVNKKQK